MTRPVGSGCPLGRYVVCFRQASSSAFPLPRSWTCSTGRTTETTGRTTAATSAVSSGILFNLSERFVGRTAVMVMHPLPDLFGGQLPRRLGDCALTVQPLRLDRVEPRRLDRQVAHPDLAPALPLHPPVVRPEPAPDPLTEVPGGVVPDQHEHLLALGRESVTQPAQEVLGHLADRPALDEAQQHPPG